MQALRGFLRNFIRWAAWNPMRMKVLHQDCMRMLRTRFVFLVESSMIRRYSITGHSWMTSTVFPAALARSRAVFVSLQTSQFECLGECVKTLWLPIGLLVPGLVDLAAKTRDRLILLQRSPSHHQVFPLLAQLQVVPPRHRVSRGVHQRGLL